MNKKCKKAKTIRHLLANLNTNPPKAMRKTDNGKIDSLITIATILSMILVQTIIITIVIYLTRS